MWPSVIDDSFIATVIVDVCYIIVCQAIINFIQVSLYIATIVQVVSKEFPVQLFCSLHCLKKMSYAIVSLLWIYFFRLFIFVIGFV